MEGAHSGPSRGIIPRAIEDVFMYIENDRNAAQSKFLVRASYLQIYNEVSQRDSMVQCAHLSVQSDKAQSLQAQSAGVILVRGLSAALVISWTSSSSLIEQLTTYWTASC